jgi:phosphatidylglycerol:prolipoprotein diacylglycerol transferase
MGIIFPYAVFFPYAVILIAGLAIGAFAMRRFATRLGIPPQDRAWLALILISVAFLGAHVFDVALYQLDEAGDRPELWFQLTRGVSLFGGVFAAGLTLLILTELRRLDLAIYADVVALGCLVATTIGRIGCAYVHDHPGILTGSALGLEVPRWREGMDGLVAGMRMHDVGLDELLLLVPLTGVVYLLAYQRKVRLRAGMLAVIIGISYASLRFALDFLRLPSTEPVHAGLTAGQWGCVVTFGVAVVGLVRVLGVGHVAPLASELGGQPGGRRRSALPRAATRLP